MRVEEPPGYLKQHWPTLRQQLLSGSYRPQPVKRVEIPIYFLGFTLYCTRNQKGNFRVRMRTEKSRLRRALMRLQDQMRRMRHEPIQEQVEHLNQMLRGHYLTTALPETFGHCSEFIVPWSDWRKMPSSRSWKGQIWWKQFQQIMARFPLLRPKLYLPYAELQAIATL